MSFTGSGLMRRLVTTIFFPGESGNDADPALAVVTDSALRARLTLKPAKSANALSGVPSYEIDFVLQGEDETPFFID